MNDSEYRELVEASWRRSLSPEEQARLNSWLAATPDLQADWEAEVALNQSLSRLPDAPLASNFTAQVLQAIDHEAAAAARRPAWFARLREFTRARTPRLAWAMVLVAALGFGVHQQKKASRYEMATGLAALANMAALPDPKALLDLDAVQHLSARPAQEDEELFKVLSQ